MTPFALWACSESHLPDAELTSTSGDDFPEQCALPHRSTAVRGLVFNLRQHEIDQDRHARQNFCPETATPTRLPGSGVHAACAPTRPGRVDVTPRRSLPGLRARDKMHDVFRGWRRFGSAFRPLANAETQSGRYRCVQQQLDESQQKLQRAASEMDGMRIAVEGARVRQMEVLAFIAHELRNPLAPIRTAAGILGRGRPEDIVAVRTIIERQVGQISRLIDDLLDVSRASTGKLRLVLAPVRVDDVVARAVEAAEPAMAGRGQKLDVIGLDHSVYLNADGTRLIQVLSNLLDNASKYSPQGQPIQLNVQCLEQSVQLSVLDRGIGISIRAMKHIFDAFNQELHAVGFNATGLGIGLAVVRDVVEAHGGRVTAFSEGLGYGSRFVVRLPRSKAMPEQASS